MVEVNVVSLWERARLLFHDEPQTELQAEARRAIRQFVQR
jgi:ABC-type multidrug transport system ATPase subunit